MRKYDVQLAWYVLAMFLTWSLWSVLMVICPVPFGNKWLRAVVRISVVLVPAVMFLRRVEKVPVIPYLTLNKGIIRGGLIGLAASAVISGLPLGYALNTQHARLQLPWGGAVWLNFILGSPIAEEVMFRGVIFQQLRSRWKLSRAAIASSLLFAAFHVPWWVISGEKEGNELMIALIWLFVFGMICAWLFDCGNSLYAPLVVHVINNLLVLSLAR